MLLALTLGSLAQAAEVANLRQDAPTEAPTAELAGPDGVESDTPRSFLMEVNLRGRYLTVPDNFLDIPYYNGTDQGGAHPERPSIRAYSVGLEFALRSNEGKGTGAMGAFYFDYYGPLIQGGYWDDREDADSPDYLDGDWLAPSQNFGIVAIGANYYYDLRLAPWFSFMVGGGLGGMYVMGDLESWDGLEDGTPAYNRTDLETAPPDGYTLADNNVPKFLPVIDINMGVKFHFNDRASLRLEGGIHNLLYVGGAVGIVF